MLPHIKTNLGFTRSCTFVVRCVATTCSARNTPVDVPLRKFEDDVVKQFVPPFDKFQQSIENCQPYLENSFEGDAFLKRNLQRILPSNVTIHK